LAGGADEASKEPAPGLDFAGAEKILELLLEPELLLP
jgi:hypothetical protein